MILIPRYVLLFSGWFAGLACAPAQSPAPEPQVQTNGASAYDEIGVYPSTAFLPAEWLSNALYQIDGTVYNDGVYNTWDVFSESGTYQVTGNERLLVLLREISAIATIRSESNVKRFAEGMKNAGKGELRDAQNVLRNPVKTAKAIPQGASRLFGRVGNTVKHAVTGELDTSGMGSPGDTAKRLIGVDEAKRQLAAELGVNPYSQNAALQKALNDAAWAQSMGNVTMQLAGGMVAPAAAANVMTGISVTNYLTTDEVKMRPEDLEKRNREALAAQGVSAEVIDALYDNPNYDPWTLSAMINAIGSLKLPRQSEIYFANAASAASEVDAYFFFRNAQLIASYHKSIAPVTELEATHRIVLCRDKNGQLIAPVWLDYLVWTPESEAAASNVQKRGGREGVTGLLILASGDISPLARSKLEQLGFKLMTRAFQPQPAN